jgi:hypothetical protein
MRAMPAIFLAVLLFPAVALAQPASPAAPASPASPSAAPPRERGASITRDEYIQRAVERARKAAAARFDRMDTNHDGVLTAEERRAARAQRRSSQ